LKKTRFIILGSSCELPDGFSTEGATRSNARNPRPHTGNVFAPVCGRGLRLLDQAGRTAAGFRLWKIRTAALSDSERAQQSRDSAQRREALFEPFHRGVDQRRDGHRRNRSVGPGEWIESKCNSCESRGTANLQCPDQRLRSRRKLGGK